MCKCPVNTPQQFKLHIQSPRHSAEVQKAAQQNNSNRSSPTDAPVPGQPLSPDPSDLQHLVTRSQVKATPGFSPCDRSPGMYILEKN